MIKSWERDIVSREETRVAKTFKLLVKLLRWRPGGVNVIVMVGGKFVDIKRKTNGGGGLLGGFLH